MISYVEACIAFSIFLIIIAYLKKRTITLRSIVTIPLYGQLILGAIGSIYYVWKGASLINQPQEFIQLVIFGGGMALLWLGCDLYRRELKGEFKGDE
jgi:threonine/homoserine/homoserine lactone efflux protein